MCLWARADSVLSGKGKMMIDKEFIAVFHYDDGGSNRCGAEPYRYAEEIVRCRECEHWSKYRTDGNQSYCEILGGYCDGDKYCAWGERSER